MAVVALPSHRPHSQISALHIAVPEQTLKTLRRVSTMAAAMRAVRHLSSLARMQLRTTRQKQPLTRLLATDSAPKAAHNGSGIVSSAVTVLAAAGAGAALTGLAFLAFEWPEGCDAMVSEFRKNGTMTELFGADAQVVRGSLAWIATLPVCMTHAFAALLLAKSQSRHHLDQ